MPERRASIAGFHNLHVIELLAPVVASIPHSTGHVTTHVVTLRRTGDDWLEMVFPELSLPGRMVTVDVACVNRDDGCRCDFVRLLRNVLVLMEQRILRATTKYVLTTIDDAATADAAKTIATLQVFVQLHERLATAKLTSLQDFDLVLSHLQSGLIGPRHRRQHMQSMQRMIESAKLSRCHVVGCELHPIDEGLPNMAPKRLALSEVFLNLTSHIDVEQMPIREDETYVARMKRAKREVLLTDLPVTVLHSVVRMLNSRELAAMSGVCSMFQHMAYEVVPGLKLLLYSHQRKALKWMLFREGSTRPELTAMPHPFLFPAIAPRTNANPQDQDQSTPRAIDLIDGRLITSLSAFTARDVRGGLFCDEPGLGKTITMLALILRTKGQQSDPSQLTSMPDPESNADTGRRLRSANSRRRTINPEKLLRSATTLIVVPNPLVEHWRYQIKTHVQRGMLTVYVDDAEGKRPMPSAEELASYDVVITSFTRLANEWKYGRPTSALEERRPDRYGFETAPMTFIDGFECRGTSALFRVHWVRIIVDEGHQLGGTNVSYHMKTARLIEAEKRWVMTGTPTPNTMHSADLRHMHGLLVFLRDRPYGEVNGEAWLKAIARPFEKNNREGYVRLLQLLNRLMMRHTKESIQTIIPKPIRHTVLVHATPREYAQYNGVVAAVRSNLLLTNIDPDYPGSSHLDSLLNPINYVYAKQVMKNLRNATCGGAQIDAILTPEAYRYMIKFLYQTPKVELSEEQKQKIMDFIRHASGIDMLTECKPCGRHLQLVMVMPCGHLNCADCVEDRYKKYGMSCAECHAACDVELFQELQPGFDFQNVENEWTYYDEPQTGNQTTTTVRSANGANENDGTGRRRRRREGESITLPQQDGNRRVFRPINLANFAPINASKAYYVANRILQLRTEMARARISEDNYWSSRSSQPTTLKAIVFSQFKEHIWRVKVTLAQHGVECADFIPGRTAAFRMDCLRRFRNDPSINVLVMTDIGSHGLDLSFVTHIFLMDEIWDKSLEQQVISRAHRMGAKRSCVVEKILMAGSIEEVIHELNTQREVVVSQAKENRVTTNEHDEGEDNDDHDDEVTFLEHRPPPSSSGRPAGQRKRRNARGLLSQKLYRSTSKAADDGGKSVVQRQRVSTLLQRLRLLDKSAVADFGIVQYKTVDEDGNVVRTDRLKLPNPGRPMPTPNGDTGSTARTTATTSSSPAPLSAAQSSTRREVSARGHSAASEAFRLASRGLFIEEEELSPSPPQRKSESTSAARRVQFLSPSPVSERPHHLGVNADANTGNSEHHREKKKSKKSKKSKRSRESSDSGRNAFAPPRAHPTTDSKPREKFNATKRLLELSRTPDPSFGASKAQSNREKKKEKRAKRKLSAEVRSSSVANVPRIKAEPHVVVKREPQSTLPTPSASGSAFTTASASTSTSKRVRVPRPKPAVIDVTSDNEDDNPPLRPEPPRPVNRGKRRRMVIEDDMTSSSSESYEEEEEKEDSPYDDSTGQH
ncbi:hypothetical protein PINS_up022134 [Pythium insidiosum]|nr:hypothetical protein PINS_up022134 [Pythium insidiosum]